MDDYIVEFQHDPHAGAFQHRAVIYYNIPGRNVFDVMARRSEAELRVAVEERFPGVAYALPRGFEIKELFAFVSTDNENGDEGVMGFHSGTGWMPMVGADMDRVQSLRRIADEIAQETGITYKVKKFRLVGEVK